MRIHFIAIGGAIMHQIAITSARKGHHVTGSDDVIQEPSRSRLQEAGILPEKEGFDAEKIDAHIELVILGMHAKLDNPELTRAMELGLKVLSFPEYIYENSRDKKRVVIAGSHGKTSITSMVMHCLQDNQIDFDYLVGSSVAGFEYSVRLSDAPIIVIEGDEYLASPINKEPKFIYYQAHLATLSGIEWDHINVFKTEAIYDAQFQKLVQSMAPHSKLFYYDEEKIRQVISGWREDVELIPYRATPYRIIDEVFVVQTEEGEKALALFGKHNMENIQAAKHICLELGVSERNFWTSIAKFEGAGRRLEKIYESSEKVIYKDFAHSPSKLKATVQAVKEKYENRYVVACFEMHTYSTLTPEFLPQYRDAMNDADRAIVFVDQSVVKKKGNVLFGEAEIRNQFHRDDIQFFTDKTALENALNLLSDQKPVYLMMSSGTFGGMDLREIGSHRFVGEATPIYSTPEEDTFSLYPTKSLLPSEVREVLLMFGLSYLLFILSPLFFYIKNRQAHTDSIYNLIAACLNFQIFSTVTLLLGFILNMYWTPLYLVGFIINSIYTYRAISQIITQKPIDIPTGIQVLIPRVDKS